MRKMKKITAVLCAALIATSVLSFPASAANISNSKYEFNFSDWGRSSTAGRAKQDRSSTYIKCTQIPDGGFKVYVDGSHSSTGGWTNRTVNGEAKASRTGEFLIQQLVYENGERYARLGAYRWWADRNAKGVWSPDSVGKFPVLKPLK